jgi:hypothetical protein
VLFRLETVQLIVWRQLAALLTRRACVAAVYVGDREDISGIGSVADDDLRELKLGLDTSPVADGFVQRPGQDN